MKRDNVVNQGLRRDKQVFKSPFKTTLNQRVGRFDHGSLFLPLFGNMEE